MDQSNTQRRPAKHLNRSNMVNMQNLTQHQQYHWNLKEDDVQQQTNQKDFHVGQPWQWATWKKKDIFTATFPDGL